MRLFRFFLTSVMLLCLCSCGGNAKSAFQPVTPRGKSKTGPSDIKETWTVVKKVCGPNTLAAKSMESYKLDQDHFIRVERLSEDEASLCKIGYVYERIISSFNATDLAYAETAVLRSIGAKKSCWKKDRGKPIGSPTSETVPFGPEELNFKLLAQDNSLEIGLKGSKECPNHLLRLSLVKKQG